MATDFPWMEDSYNAVNNWNVSSTQQNEDRGAMKDAFQIDTAEAYVDYNLSQGMLESTTESEAQLAKVNADLELRNTRETMAAENQYKQEGMVLSNDLSKDYEKAATGNEIAVIGATGSQNRLLQQTVDQGKLDQIGAQGGEDRETVVTTGEQERLGIETSGEQQRLGIETTGTQERLNIGATGEETRQNIGKQGEENRAQAVTEGEQQRLGTQTQGSETRLNIGAQGAEDRAGTVTSGEQERLNIGTRGTEDRSTLEKQGDVSRRNVAFEREHAFSLARAGARR